MRYVIARVDATAREHAYRIYVTDSLKGITGGNARYIDLFTQEEERTPVDIIDGIRGKLGE